MKLNLPNKINQIPSNNYYFIANKYNICTQYQQMGTISITNLKFQTITTTFQNIFTKLKKLNCLGILL